MKPKKPAKKEKTYLGQPKVLSSQHLKKLEREGKRVPRGVIFKSPRAKLKSAERIGIKVLGKGSVKVPYYKGEFDKLGHEKLVLERVDTVKNLNAAVRRSSHALAGVKEEINKNILTCQLLADIHQQVVDRWKGLSPSEREALIAGLRQAQQSITRNPQMLKNQAKKDAFNAIEDALDKLEGKVPGSSSSAAASLIKATNDLLQRRNTLLKQRPFLARREVALFSKVSAREKPLVDALSSLQRIIDELRAPRDITVNRLTQINRAVFRLGKSEVAKGNVTRLRNAVSAINRGDMELAVANLGEASGFFLEKLSKESPLALTKLEGLFVGLKEQWLKKQIVRNQLDLSYDNLIFWHGKAKNRQKVYDYFNRLVNHSIGLMDKEELVHLTRARQALGRKNYSLETWRQELGLALGLEPV